MPRSLSLVFGRLDRGATIGEMAMTWLRAIGQWIMYGGSSKLRGYEEELLNYTCGVLDEPDRSALAAQVASVDRVQRYLKGRMVRVFLGPRETGLARLSEHAESHCVVKLKIRSRGRSVSAAVVSHLGLLSSLEFSRPPKEHLAAGLEVVSAVRGERWHSPSDAADRLEHGA